MDALTHRISAWDGLALRVLEWDGGGDRLPLLCLPGLVRTAGDFAGVADVFCAGRRVLAVDYPGRGESGRSDSIARYDAGSCLRDIMDVCAALHVHRAVVIGTSFGGLLAMGLTAARPGLVGGVLLNDVGPEIGRSGADFVRGFVGSDPALPDLAACVAFLRSALPPLSLVSRVEWEEMARLTYSPGPDGRWHPLWDTRIAHLLDREPPDLWALFGAMAHVKLLLVRGSESDILSRDTTERMRMRRPDMACVEVPGVGHAPTLCEPMVVDAMRSFLEQVA